MSIVKTASGTSSEKVAHTVVLLESIRPTYQTTPLADIKKKESDMNWEKLLIAIALTILFCAIAIACFWLARKNPIIGGSLLLVIFVPLVFHSIYNALNDE